MCAGHPEPCPTATGGSGFTIEIGSDFVIGPRGGIPQPTPFTVERSPLRTMDSTGGISRLLRRGLGDSSCLGASCRTHDANGVSVRTLWIGKEELPGRWRIAIREFMPAK